jgi:hypothetical protein
MGYKSRHLITACFWSFMWPHPKKCFPSKILSTFLIHSILTTHTIDCNLHDFTPLTVLGKQYNSQRSLLCKILKQSSYSSYIQIIPSAVWFRCLLFVLPSSNKLHTLELYKTVSYILNSSIYNQFPNNASPAKLTVHPVTLTTCYSFHSCQTIQSARYKHILPRGYSCFHYTPWSEIMRVSMNANLG